MLEREIVAAILRYLKGVAGKVTSVEDVKRLLADMELASAGEERRDI